MSGFERLHPAIQHHVVNSLGWRSLRPLQEQAVEPLLSGSSALLIAPTAGGKTEAAILPLLSRLLSEDWPPIGVLYVCPIKALLNDLEHRLRRYAEWSGRRVAVWHGDIRQADRAAIRRAPPDILLTTPESLEVMLASGRSRHAGLLLEVRAVVVDEVHAFAGDDRGWHLVAVLDRIAHLGGRSIQRIGLSATVGNPAELLAWLSGGARTPGAVIAPAPANARDAEVGVDYVGSLENAAIVIARLYRGEKRLVFCDSRVQVESLAALLRQHGVETYVSHSSLAAEERRRAEQAFGQASGCVIVATSALELGIDVGDLDRVIQVDAPATVAAFLQRLGRTGRRPGTRRNCLFLATSTSALLQVLSLLELWRAGYVEPVAPPPRPYHVLAQQLLSLCLQGPGTGRNTWPRWLGGMLAAAEIGPSERERLVEHMVDNEYLFEDQGILAVGSAGEAAFGKRHYLRLFSVFDSPPLFSVVHGRTVLGAVHQSTFQIETDQPRVLTLGGRSWRVRHLDWGRRQAFVEPSDRPGSSRWIGAGRSLSFELAQAVQRVLSGALPEVELSQRARAERETVLARFDWVDAEHAILEAHPRGISWWTFGGDALNAALAATLQRGGTSPRHDGLALHFTGDDAGPVLERVRELLDAGHTDITPNVSDPLRQAYKFGECVPPQHLEAMIAARFSCTGAWRRIRERGLRVVRVR